MYQLLPQVTGFLAPEAASESTVVVRTISHEEADAQVLRQRQGGQAAADAEAAGAAAAKAAAAAASAATAAKAGDAGDEHGKPSLLHMSHAVMLVESWGLAGEADEEGGHEGGGEADGGAQDTHGARAHGEGQGGRGGRLQGRPRLGAKQGGRRPDGRELQAAVTDLPASDPRQCIFPT